MRRTPARLLAALAAATPLLLAACGGSGSSGSAAPAAKADVTVVAPGGLKFDAKAYTAPKSGDLTIALQNKDAQTHSLVIEDANGDKVGSRMLVAGGSTKTEQVSLPSGQYKVVCDVPGHAGAGMKATLTVP